MPPCRSNIKCSLLKAATKTALSTPPSHYKGAKARKSCTLLPDAEGTLLDDWKAASAHSLQDVWDNNEDAVYDYA